MLSIWLDRYRELRRRAKEGLEKIVAAVEFLLDPSRSRETTLAELCRQVDEEELQAALVSCRAFQHLEERGFLDEICSHYSYLRRYFPALFELPFEAEPGSSSLLEALAIVHRLDCEELRKLAATTPVDFVPPAWRKFLLRGDGLLDRRAWEIALGFALRAPLRGYLLARESAPHVVPESGLRRTSMVSGAPWRLRAALFILRSRHERYAKGRLGWIEESNMEILENSLMFGAIQQQEWRIYEKSLL